MRLSILKTIVRPQGVVKSKYKKITTRVASGGYCKTLIMNGKMKKYKNHTTEGGRDTINLSEIKSPESDMNTTDNQINNSTDNEVKKMTDCILNNNSSTLENKSHTAGAPTIQETLEQCIQFFEAINKPLDNVFIRAIDHKKKLPPKNLDNLTINIDTIKYLRELNDQGYEIYYVVNGGGRNSESIDETYASFYEIDEKDFTGEKIPFSVQSEAWREVYTPQPTIVVCTGGKSLHQYLGYEEGEDVPKEKWKELQIRLMATIPHTDTAIKDFPRIMRLPGLKYHKDGLGNYSYIYDYCGDTYTVAEIEENLPSLIEAQQILAKRKEAKEAAAVAREAANVDAEMARKEAMSSAREAGETDRDRIIDIGRKAAQKVICAAGIKAGQDVLDGKQPADDKKNRSNSSNQGCCERVYARAKSTDVFFTTEEEALATLPGPARSLMEHGIQNSPQRQQAIPIAMHFVGLYEQGKMSDTLGKRMLEILLVEKTDDLDPTHPWSMDDVEKIWKSNLGKGAQPFLADEDYIFHPGKKQKEPAFVQYLHEDYQEAARNGVKPSLVPSTAKEITKYIKEHVAGPNQDDKQRYNMCFAVVRFLVENSSREVVNYTVKDVKKWLNEVLKEKRRKLQQSELAAAIAEDYRGTLAFNVEEKTWYKFNHNGANHIWSLLDDIAIESVVMAGLDEKQGKWSNSTLTNVVKILQKHLAAYEWNKTDGLIAMNNGVLKLGQRNTLRDGAPADYLTNKLSFNYDPEAKCDKLLADIEVMADSHKERYDLIMAMLWISIFCQNGLKCFFELVGRGGNNGKSTIISLMSALVGHGNYYDATVREFDATHGLAGIRNKTAIFVRDAGSYVPGVDVIKSLTGGDPITVNPKFKDMFSVVFDGVLAMATNNHLVFPDGSEAIFRRRISIPFTKVFQASEQHSTITMTNKGFVGDWVEQLPGLFNHLLREYNYDKVKVIIEKYRAGATVDAKEARLASVKTNSAMAWALECLTYEPGEWIARSDVSVVANSVAQPYKHYQTWCLDNGLRQISAPKWKQAILSLTSQYNVDVPKNCRKNNKRVLLNLKMAHIHDICLEDYILGEQPVQNNTEQKRPAGTQKRVIDMDEVNHPKPEDDFDYGEIPD